MKTHFGIVENGNESNPRDEWSDPICGVYADNPDMTNKWEFVNCKKCLKRKDVFEKQMQQARNHELKQLDEHLKT